MTESLANIASFECEIPVKNLTHKKATDLPDAPDF